MGCLTPDRIGSRTLMISPLVFVQPGDETRTWNLDVSPGHAEPSDAICFYLYIYAARTVSGGCGGAVVRTSHIHSMYMFSHLPPAEARREQTMNPACSRESSSEI